MKRVMNPLGIEDGWQAQFIICDLCLREERTIGDVLPKGWKHRLVDSLTQEGFVNRLDVCPNHSRD